MYLVIELLVKVINQFFILGFFRVTKRLRRRSQTVYCGRGFRVLHLLTFLLLFNRYCFTWDTESEFITADTVHGRLVKLNTMQKFVHPFGFLSAPSVIWDSDRQIADFNKASYFHNGKKAWRCLQKKRRRCALMLIRLIFQSNMCAIWEWGNETRKRDMKGGEDKQVRQITEEALSHVWMIFF